MTQLLKLSGSEFKITKNNALKALVEKMDSMYDHIIVSEERRKG